MRILVAGIGNIFFGDDAFGCEVAKALSAREMPEGVEVRDFGIRSYDLAYALMEHYDLRILVDASPCGLSPGTLVLLEPDMKGLDEAPGEVVNAHSMNPVRVLQLVRSLGGQPGKLFVIGCEPDRLEAREGALGLSEKVQAAVGPAMKMVEDLIADFINGREIGGSMPKKLTTETAGEA